MSLSFQNVPNWGHAKRLVFIGFFYCFPKVVFRDALFDLGRFLPDGEFNYGLILAETACMEIPILVTSDDHLLGIEAKALLAKFKERSLHPTLPIAPWKIARAVR